MDQWSRHIIGFGVRHGSVDCVGLCRMFNQATSGANPPRYLSSDNDPLFRFHRWQVTLRVLPHSFGNHGWCNGSASVCSVRVSFGCFCESRHSFAIDVSATAPQRCINNAGHGFRRFAPALLSPPKSAIPHSRESTRPTAGIPYQVFPGCDHCEVHSLPIWP